MLEIYLKNEGYVVLKASDGAEALELLENNEVDLIILDVMMPRMDGLQACMKIREEKQMPIIMLSAKTQEIYFHVFSCHGTNRNFRNKLLRLLFTIFLSPEQKIHS
ncbi:putative transcriptional regulatory protein YclJ [Paenibacillus larvae subsp. larvae]|uniref:Putative transcriptional regulatory protein YclJ n=1 Tax=Paenibacillus larvae subsp. larvae TaxID=147375 RepID=A0A2L1U0M6_9BACL|nr:putative transcriptional regulatory protein YclJ [Paenibacillus larvae subsp. larvae]AVF31266.1 putative transcriptional regulatory protein YclJ [Paenibacillus larvae subsp. larvae]